MRTKDQMLLENAYEQVLKEGIGKALGTAALAAGMAFGSPKAVNAQDMDRAGIESITNPELSPDGALEEVLNTLRYGEYPLGNSNEELPENLFKRDTLLKASMSKNIEDLQRLTDTIQLKGYKVPPYFKNYRVFKTPIGP